MKYLHRTAGIVTAFCLMIILFITSVEAVVYWTPGYFEKEYAKYNVLDSLPSMTMNDLLHVTDEMMDYLRGDRDDLHVTTTMGGEQREFFNEREIAHMKDVQVLFLKALSIRRVCLVLGAGLLILMAATKARMGRVLPPSLCMGTGLFFALITVLGLIISTDFTKYFIMFHHIFFSNDLWILDPATDMLINIVPEGFFSDTVLHIGITFFLCVVIVFGLALFFLRKSKKNNV